MRLLYVGFKRILILRRAFFLLAISAVFPPVADAHSTHRPWNHPKHALVVEAVPIGGPSKNSGQTVSFQGQIKLLHLDHNGNDHDCEFRGKQLIRALQDEALVPKFTFPDALTEVSPQLQTSSDLVTFVFNSAAVDPNNFNVFSAEIAEFTPSRDQLRKTQSKLELRIIRIQSEITRLQSKSRRTPSQERQLRDLIEARNSLQATVDRVLAKLSASGELVAKITVPLIVDNKATPPMEKVSRGGPFSLAIKFDTGAAIQGMDTAAHGTISQVLDSNAVDDKEFVAQFYFKNQLLKSFPAQDFDVGTSVSFDLPSTGKLLASGTNAFTERLYRSKKKKLGDLWATLEHTLLVVNDGRAPEWQVGSSLTEQPPYAQGILPVIAIVRDPLGRLDLSTFKATLVGPSGSQDVTTKLSKTSLDGGISAEISGDLNQPPLPNGTYTLSFTIKDLAGLSSGLSTSSFVLDHTPPTILLGVQDPIRTRSSHLDIPVTVTDSSPTLTTVFVNGVVTYTNSEPTFTASVDLVAGPNHIEVASQDQAGNTATPVRLMDVTFDNQPPAILSFSPAAGSILTSLDVPISGSFNEEVGGVRVNNQEMLLSADKKSFTGSIRFASEANQNLHLETADLTGNVVSKDYPIQIIVRLIRQELLSVFPAQDGQHLIIRGAPASVVPGLTVNASGSLLNNGSTVAAEDGSFSITLSRFQSATLSVYSAYFGRTETAEVAWGPSQGTLLSGYVRSTTGKPLAGATVNILSTNAVTRTDSAGVFIFSQRIPTGDQMLHIDGSTVTPDSSESPRTYGAFNIAITIGVNQANVLSRAISLSPMILDGTEANVSVTHGATVTNPHAPGVILQIPAGSMHRPDGATTGPVTMATVSAEFATTPLPSNIQPKTVVSLDPPGATFSEPVTITMQNRDQLPAGTEVVILSQNSASGTWEVGASAVVDAGGQTITTKDGQGLRHFSQITAVPLGPTVLASSAQDKAGADTFNGSLSTNVQLPSFRSMNRSVSPSLLYKSAWAKPTALVTNTFDLPTQTVELSVPPQSGSELVKYQVDLKRCVLSGRQYECRSDLRDFYDLVQYATTTKATQTIQPDFITAKFQTGSILSPELSFTGLPDRAAISYAFDLKNPATGQYFESGIYPYQSHYEVHFKETIVGTQQTTVFQVNQPPEIRNPVSFPEIKRQLDQIYPQDLAGPLFVQNEMQSAAGRGWRVSGAGRIVGVSPSGASSRVMLEESDGSVRSYGLQNTIDTVFDAADSSVDLKNGVGLSQWPFADLTSADAKTFYRADLTQGAPTASVSGSNFNVQGTIGGYDFYNFTSAQNGRFVCDVRACHTCFIFCGSAFPGNPSCNGAFVSDIGCWSGHTEFDHVPYSSCHQSSYAYTMPSQPSGLLTLPNGEVLGTDLKRNVVFRAGSSGGALVAGSLSSPPTFSNNYSVQSDSHQSAISSYCSTQGVDCSLQSDTGVSQPGGFNSCGSPTVASSGTFPVAGYGGNGDGSLSNPLNHPMGIIAGKLPNTVVIADTGNHVVRQLDLVANTMTIVAGNNQTMDFGDGGPATSAGIFAPRGLAYDAIGNLYISTGSGLIRKIDNNGTITTIAGMPPAGQPKVFADTTTAELVDLSDPYGLVVSPDNLSLYVADTGHHRVLRIDLTTLTATTVAGTGGNPGFSGDQGPGLAATLSSPTALGLDNSGNLIIADSGNNRIRRLSFQAAGQGVLAYTAIDKDRSSLVRQSDGNWKRTFRNGDAVYYDTFGRQTTAVTREGLQTTFAYNSAGLLLSITDATGQSIQYNYSGNRLSSITDPAGRSTTLGYDGQGNLVAINFPNGTHKNFVYNADGLMIAELNEKGAATQYTYNVWNRLETVTKPSGETITVNDSGSATAANNYTGGAQGTLKKIGKDAGDVSDSVTDAKQVKTTFIKDYGGYLTSLIDGAGNTTDMQRDREGRVVKMTVRDVQGNIVRSSSNVFDPVTGDQLSETDTQTGVNRQQTFDAFGNVLTVTQNRRVGGQPLVTTRNYFEGTNLVSSITDPTGRVTSFTYHPTFKSLLGTSQDAGDGTVIGNSSTLDTHGNRVSRLMEGGRSETYVLDSAGNMVSIQDSTGKAKCFEHDLMNRVVAVTTGISNPGQCSQSGSGKKTSYSYSPTGEMLTISDSQGNVTSMTYDPAGNMKSKTDPTGSTTQYTYDFAGNVTQEVDAKGNVKKFTYDAQNNLLQKQLPEGTVTFTYNSKGKLTSAANAASNTTFEYDSQERVIRTTLNSLGPISGMGASTVSFGYDDDGNRTSVSDSFGGNFTYSYDGGNRLVGITNASGESTTVSYDGASRLTRIVQQAGSLDTRFEYDTKSFLSRITTRTNGNVLADLNYVRDHSGAITSVTDSSATKSFGYDQEYQLTSVSSTFPGERTTETFSYDSIYNRIADASGAYTYDAKHQRLMEDWQFIYLYDANGNLASRQEKSGFPGSAVTNYSYSSENQLVAVRVHAPGQSQPVREVTYYYDGIGRRIQKVVVDHTAENDLTKSFTRGYVYDGEGILLELDGSGALLARYTHSQLAPDDLLSVQVTQDGASAHYAPSAGTYGFVKDHQGSITDIVNSSGSKVQHYVYSAFGVLLGIQDAQGADITANPNVRSPFAFNGREFDSETGLYCYRARYYDPNVGRFLQKDTEPGKVKVPVSTVNSYIYVANNPINLMDPLGKSFWDVLFGVFSTILLAVAFVFPLTALAVVGVTALIDPAAALSMSMTVFNMSLFGQIPNLISQGRFARLETYHGVLYVRDSMFGGGGSDGYGGGFAPGMVVFVSTTWALTPTQEEALLRHEYGHVLQWNKYKWNYLGTGRPLAGSPNWFECEAGQLSRDLLNPGGAPYHSGYDNTARWGVGGTCSALGYH